MTFEWTYVVHSIRFCAQDNMSWHAWSHQAQLLAHKCACLPLCCRLQSDRQEVAQRVLGEAAHYGRFATAVYATLPRLPRAAGWHNPLSWLTKHFLPRRKRTAAAVGQAHPQTSSQPATPDLTGTPCSPFSAPPPAGAASTAAAPAEDDTAAGGAATGAAQRLGLEGMAEGLLLEQLVATAGK